VIAIIAAIIIAFFNVGSWLLVEDNEPESLDLIFSFSGERVRNTYARELMGKYASAHWLMSDYKNGYNRILRKSNFDENRFSFVDTCSNTLAEVSALYDWIGQNKNTRFSKNNKVSIGLISSPYHMRRIKMMVDKRFGKKNVFTFHYLPVPLYRYKWTKEQYRYWWRFSGVSDNVISEIQKIVYFFLVFGTI
jgi:uncharacterized SAM-binding protein YcdF (DUF218 family)